MGFTQWQVAALLGYLTRNDLSHYERGQRVPSLVTALKFEIVYRVPVAFLFADLNARLRRTAREANAMNSRFALEYSPRRRVRTGFG